MKQVFYIRDQVYNGFNRLAKELGYVGYGSKAKFLTKVIDKYWEKLHGQITFVTAAGLTDCKCNREKRFKTKSLDSAKSYRTLYLGKDLKDTLNRIAKVRSLSVSGMSSASLNTLLQAAILTFASEIDKRPTVFCDVCLEPVDGTIFLYADKRYNAPAYYVVPISTGVPILMPYQKGKKQAIFSTVGHAHVLYNSDGLQPAQLAKELDFSVERVISNLIELTNGNYIAACPKDKPRLV